MEEDLRIDSQPWKESRDWDELEEEKEDKRKKPTTKAESEWVISLSGSKRYLGERLIRADLIALLRAVIVAESHGQPTYDLAERLIDILSWEKRR